MLVSTALSNFAFAATDKATDLGYSAEIVNEVRLINDKSLKNDIDIKLNKKVIKRLLNQMCSRTLTELGYTRVLFLVIL
jgi:hypothetical protein